MKMPKLTDDQLMEIYRAGATVRWEKRNGKKWEPTASAPTGLEHYGVAERLATLALLKKFLTFVKS